jgi:hypothetical protein
MLSTIKSLLVGISPVAFLDNDLLYNESKCYLVTNFQSFKYSLPSAADLVLERNSV